MLTYIVIMQVVSDRSISFLLFMVVCFDVFRWFINSAKEISKIRSLSLEVLSSTGWGQGKRTHLLRLPNQLLQLRFLSLTHTHSHSLSLSSNQLIHFFFFFFCRRYQQHPHMLIGQALCRFMLSIHLLLWIIHNISRSLWPYISNPRSLHLNSFNRLFMVLGLRHLPFLLPLLLLQLLIPICGEARWIPSLIYIYIFELIKVSVYPSNGMPLSYSVYKS